MSGRQNQQQKLKKEEEEGGDGDRISSLSDELLHMILSFMNAKYAVQTCVLSKRWIDLWKSLPYLDFNHTTFPFKRGQSEGEEGYSNEPKMISLCNFITQVLFRRHRRSDLVKVCFQSNGYGPYASIMEGLIAYAVDHDVQELTIETEFFVSLMMPQSFYTCKSLTSLQLLDETPCYTPILPKSLALPALKALHLRGFCISETPGNFSACPNLEILKLEDIYFFANDKTFIIKAPNLKRLELSWCSGCKVMIHAPRLMTFQYRTHESLLCLFDDLASIEAAYVDIRYKDPLKGFNEEDVDDGEGDTNYRESRMGFDKYRGNVLHCINAFKKFHHAKSLTLSWSTVKGLSMFPSLLDENRSPFPNLKYLNIRSRKWQQRNKVDIPAYVLNFFLNSSTTLKLCA